ncbi:MAG: hypothetical protein UHS51_01730 [Atopobiaceae bacterium]|nr:hypothetical protein [Atopobiaceae bacterium]
MANHTGKKKMTLSEHLALRAKAAEESNARNEARLHRVHRLKELDSMVVCTCPACVRLRNGNRRPAAANDPQGA